MVSQDSPQTIRVFLAETIYSHPLIASPFEQQFYVSYENTTSDSQLIVVATQSMPIPTQHQVAIDMSGELKTIQLDGRPGTKSSYRNAVFYLSEWKYAQPASFKPCWYMEKSVGKNSQGDESEFSQHKDCAYFASHQQLRINPTELKKMTFSHTGIATINFNGHFFYLNQSGLARQVLTFDNWADDFQEGLARTQSNGKIGYINQQLEVAIPAIYDWALPFSKNVAMVCLGCRLEPMGEHQSIVGGRWGIINQQGKIVVGINSSWSQAQKQLNSLISNHKQ